jgi:hypothetical protein
MDLDIRDLRGKNPGVHEDDNIRMDVRETGWEFVDWIHLTQDRDQWRTLVNTIMNLRAHKRRGIS